MPKRKFYGVERNRSRLGALRWYYRPPGDKKAPRVRLPDAYGSAEFEAAWRACRAGLPLPALPGHPQARRTSRGSLGWLIALYLASPEFKSGKPTTLRIRRAVLEKLAADKGAVDLEDIDRGAIQDSLEARRSTPAMANAWLTAVRGLFAWAQRERLPDPASGVIKPILDENPCAGVSRLAVARSGDPDEEVGHPTWSDGDLGAFEPAYPLGTRERRVYAILLFTGLRLGDAGRLGRQHVQRNGSIRIKTEKTGIDVNIDIVPPLQRALDAGPHGRPEVLNFITGPKGKAIEKTFLGKWFGERCRAIRLERSAHGLRKAAARRYAERGATVTELMALFGWKDPRIAIHYVEMANRKRMAISAQGRMDWERIEAEISPTRLLVGE